MRNSKGFTMVEIMVVTAVIGIMALVAVPILGGRAEKDAVNEMELKIPTFIRGYLDKSFETGQRFGIRISFRERYIRILDTNNKVIDEMRLSSRLVYTGEDFYDTNLVREITELGNFSKGFTFLVFDKKQSKAYTVITADATTTSVQFGKVRVYKPKGCEYLPAIKAGNFDKNRVLWEVDSDK